MPRIPRSFTVFPDSCIHKIWRGHNKEWNLHSDNCKLAYLDFMNKELLAEENTHTTVHALTLMDSHSHEVVHVQEQKAFSNLMRRHHGRYGQYFNKNNNRSGKVAEDRPKTCLLEDEYAQMIVTFYVHANPLRSQMTHSRAVNYRWSTHKLYAFGQREAWMEGVQFPSWYMKLGSDMPSRQQKYRKLFSQYLKERGLEKSSQFSKPFYGSSGWVQQQNEHLRKKFREKYGSDPPLL